MMLEALFFQDHFTKAGDDAKNGGLISRVTEEFLHMAPRSTTDSRNVSVWDQYKSFPFQLKDFVSHTASLELFLQSCLR